MAAGRGSRMKGYDGNKTILPLVPEGSVFEGSNPILLHILKNLPPGPKAVIVNHRKEDVIGATRNIDLAYCEQPELNGTGGALLAAQEFLEDVDYDRLIIAMGDVPLVRSGTYLKLVQGLKNDPMIVLGFRPESKKRYGMLDIESAQVTKIIEWEYWKSYTEDRQRALQVCNSGIYAVKKGPLLHYLSVLASRPHIVHKDIDGRLRDVDEYFITDLVEYMHDDGLNIGYATADEEEVMGIDDLPALQRAQEIFLSQMGRQKKS